MPFDGEGKSRIIENPFRIGGDDVSCFLGQIMAIKTEVNRISLTVIPFSSGTTSIGASTGCRDNPTPKTAPATYRDEDSLPPAHEEYETWKVALSLR